MNGNGQSGTTRPLVSVVILNYKRLDVLRVCLDSVLAQTYPSREIIVVDNHSEQDVRSHVESLSTDIHLIELPENLGTCGGRNAGIAVAKGEIIVTIDNDVIFTTPNELDNIVNAFAQHPASDVLTFHISDTQARLRLREWCHPRYWKEFSEKEFETTFLPEGASAYRRRVFDVAGLYYQPFFIGHEGGDLAFRIMDHGLRILYAPSVRVCHLASEETRSSSRTIHLYTRNYIWLAFKDFSTVAAIRYLLPKLAMMFYHAIRAAHVRHYFRGLWDGIAGLPQIHRDRTPISSATVRYVNEIEKTRPGLWLRLERHRARPQI